VRVRPSWTRGEARQGSGGGGRGRTGGAWVSYCFCRISPGTLDTDSPLAIRDKAACALRVAAEAWTVPGVTLLRAWLIIEPNAWLIYKS
jgi:hypothetical protein